MKFVRTAVLCCLMVFPPCLLGAWPWPDSVVDYSPGPGQWSYPGSPFNDTSRLFGPPRGISVSQPDNSGVITLGDGGSVTVYFEEPIYDDPRNPHGLDFIVFSNALWSGGDPTLRWQEPAFVEVSEDGDIWYLILPNILPGDLIGAPHPDRDTGTSRTVLRGYAQYTPTLPLPPDTLAEEFYTVPNRPAYADDPESLLIDAGSGGGDAMDIGWAVKQVSPGVPEYGDDGVPVSAGLTRIHYIRLTDAVVGDYQGILGEISAEIDTVAAVLPEVQPLGAAIAEGEGKVVHLDEVVVTRILPSQGAWVQSLDRSSGAFVSGLQDFAPGSRVKVIGRNRKDDRGCFIHLYAGRLIKQTNVPTPLRVSTKSLTSVNGLSLGGMLVSTWGHVESGPGMGELCLRGADGSVVRIVGSAVSLQVGSQVMITGTTRKTEDAVWIYLMSSEDVKLLTPASGG